MVGFKLFNFTHELLALSLRTRAARHEVLSANIANADTPGYRPKDLDFNAVMKSAVEASANGGAEGPGPKPGGRKLRVPLQQNPNDGNHLQHGGDFAGDSRAHFYFADG